MRIIRIHYIFRNSRLKCCNLNKDIKKNIIERALSESNIWEMNIDFEKIDGNNEEKEDCDDNSSDNEEEKNEKKYKHFN